jgi:hypothetical protein
MGQVDGTPLRTIVKRKLPVGVKQLSAFHTFCVQADNQPGRQADNQE